jgi:hypothetical protein
LCGEQIGASAEITNCFWDVETSGIGATGDDNFGATGKETDDMTTKSTFTGVGWDFVGEAANGEEDVWRMCVDGIVYPRLAWEFSSEGDFVCGDGVDADDLVWLAREWLVERASLADANFDEKVNLKDMAVLAANWLGGTY